MGCIWLVVLEAGEAQEHGTGMCSASAKDLLTAFKVVESIIWETVNVLTRIFLIKPPVPPLGPHSDDLI